MRRVYTLKISNTVILLATLITYNEMTMKKRHLTFNQQIVQMNLKTLWNREKSKSGLTQQKAAELAGWSTQATVNQYLNGYIPLNLKATFTFARILGIPVTDIDPNISSYFPESNTEKNLDALPLPEKYASLPKAKRDFIAHILAMDKDKLEILMLLAEALTYKKTTHDNDIAR